MSAKFRRNLLVSSGISMLILIISSTASYLSIKSLLNSYELVNHTHDVIYNLNAGATDVVDSQSTVRGYLVTGEKDFLDQYRITKGRSGTYFKKVQALTDDNPVQQKNLLELEPARRELFKYLEYRISEKDKGHTSTAIDLDKGKMLINKIRTVLKRMEHEEQRLLAERTGTSGRYSQYSVVLIIAAAIIALIISVVFFLRILRDYTQRTKLTKQLEDSEKETSERIRIISNVAEQIAQGNYAIRVDDSESDALGSVSLSLNNMASSLYTSFNLLSDKEWLQSGIAELNRVMIGQKNPDKLSKDIIDHIAKYTNSSAGAIYLLEGDRLRYVAGYGYVPARDREQFKLGDGLLGQAAVSGEILDVKSFAPENIKIGLALGEIVPAHIAAVPLIDDKVAGVAELATVQEFSELHMEFLKTAAHNAAIAITAAQNSKRVQELLEETEAQSEELRAQHTELEGMNAELEAQTQKLQASEEELRVQQEELQQTNEELAERSVLLEEKNMEIQKKSEDLELTTRYKSEFLANMSHELRTPLNSILLLSRLLSENNDRNMNDEQIEFAKVIQSSGNGLLGLIDEILDLSKIEAGKMDLEFQDITIKEIVDNLNSLFKEVAREKGIEFNIDYKEAPLLIKTDKMRLEQILKNLISNAIKFTSVGAVTLTVKKDVTDNNRVLFSVKDTGIGIPREKQPLIFEAFQQADGSTKRKYGGTGLGLSISRELAKLLKGEISLKSEVNEGSEFTLTIPVTVAGGLQTVEVIDRAPLNNNFKPQDVKEDKEQQDMSQYLSSSIPNDIADDRDNLSAHDKIILIVEDDVNFAASLLKFTRQRGYKGVVSVRGDQALNLAIMYKPVGVLLDIQLPVKSGWEVMEELKGNIQTRHIPVHIMSSHKVKQESLLKGAVNFLDKPVAYEMLPEIFKRIEHIINKESKKVLIIEDNSKHAKALGYFLETYNINSEIKSEISDGVAALKSPEVDCVILDMGIPDNQAYEILENVKKNEGLENLPVIVFTGKSLSMKEELRIKKYADSIVIKTAHSYQRMLDEVSLFLHLVEENKKEGGKSKKSNLLNDILHNKTVLIVDDDVRNIFSLTKALEALKIKTITAIDGKEALKALDENQHIDLVLLDMMMPNMDGYETATRIRQNSRLRNLPVIAVTAKAMTGDREKCINAGASDYITKPVDMDQLMSLLRVWLYDKLN